MARVIVEATGDAALVHVSRAGLRHTLSSLLSNAFDASTGREPVRVTVHADGAARSARLEVRDRGPAMSAEVLARAGEPFFTTKDAGRGLGLGLFLARVFAERSGGTLSIAAGQGTAVVLELPLHGEAARA